MRNEEWAKQTRVAPKHRAKREIKRTRGPGARGLEGSRGKAPAEFEAEPHSAQADKVQSGVRRMSDLFLLKRLYRSV